MITIMDMASGMGINTAEASKMSTKLGGLAGDKRLSSMLVMA